jgi:hypothetical protein
MADITVTSAPGTALEKVTITSAGDTALANITVTFSTTVFTRKELVIKALAEITEILEGWNFPPPARTP